MLKLSIFNACLLFVWGLGHCKFKVAMIGEITHMTLEGKLRPLGIGSKHFEVTEFKFPDIDELFSNKSVYSVDLRLNESGLIFKKSKANIKKAQSQGANAKGLVSKVEPGDFVRFIDQGDVMELGSTQALASGMDFSQILDTMSIVDSSEPVGRELVPIDRKITLVEYQDPGMDVMELYKLFTSHQAVMAMYVQHKKLKPGDPVLAFPDETATFAEFLADSSGVFEIFNTMFLKFVVRNILEPLYYSEMDVSDRENAALDKLFSQLITQLSLEADFFKDYELVFSEESFLEYANKFLGETQAANLLIETVMMSVSTRNENLFVQLITEDIETNEEVQDKVEDSLANILYVLGTNIFMNLRRDIEIEPKIPMIAKVKPILEVFGQKVLAEPSLAKYQAQFEKVGRLLLPVFVTNFTPEVIEVFFWLFQTSYGDFISHYLFFSDQLAGFASFFADADLKIDEARVKEVWKYIHPDHFSEFKTVNFAVIKNARRTLI